MREKEVTCLKYDIVIRRTNPVVGWFLYNNDDGFLNSFILGKTAGIKLIIFC
jgi:hypothetical protein